MSCIVGMKRSMKCSFLNCSYLLQFLEDIDAVAKNQESRMVGPHLVAHSLKAVVGNVSGEGSK